MHREAAEAVPKQNGVQADLWQAQRAVWDEALERGEKHGYKNGQVTVLAPTGTIAFMMDCDTTGVEPDIALVKYKKLVGGGLLKIVNGTVPMALAKLGYEEAQIAEIVEYIDEKETIEGAPNLKRDEHLWRSSTARSARMNGSALDRLDGAHPHDGCGPAVPLRSDQQDGEPAPKRPRWIRRLRTGLRRGLEATVSRPWPSTGMAASAPSR